MIKIIKNRATQLSFKNGLTISIAIGDLNYCDRKNPTFNPTPDPEMLIQVVKSGNAEIAIYDSQNNWFNFGSDEVLGWVNPDDLANWIHWTQSARDLEDLKVQFELKTTDNKSL